MTLPRKKTNNHLTVKIIGFLSFSINSHRARQTTVAQLPIHAPPRRGGTIYKPISPRAYKIQSSVRGKFLPVQ